MTLQEKYISMNKKSPTENIFLYEGIMTETYTGDYVNWLECLLNEYMHNTYALDE